MSKLTKKLRPTENNLEKIPKQSGVYILHRGQSGRAKKGIKGKEFSPARPVWGWESVSAIPALAGRQNRKIFIFLIEKIVGGAQLKYVKKIFLFCSPLGERKRWADHSAKSSGFCSKKVLTSSSRHHHFG